MLPAGNRLTRSRDFALAVRRGRRAARPTLVVHLLVPNHTDVASGQDRRAGLVVSRRVGGSVVRHAVARRLRHLIRPWLDSMPAGSLLVVRALPAAATASGGELAADLGAALLRCGIPPAVAAAAPARSPAPTSGGTSTAAGDRGLAVSTP